MRLEVVGRDEMGVKDEGMSQTRERHIEQLRLNVLVLKPFSVPPKKASSVNRSPNQSNVISITLFRRWL